MNGKCPTPRAQETGKSPPYPGGTLGDSFDTSISATVPSEMGLLSECSFLDFGVALSTAVLIAVRIISAYLSRSLVDASPVKSAEPKAASSVDSNTSVGLIEFVPGVVSR